MTWGCFKPHEAAVTVDPTMARRLQGCWPFRVFQGFFPPMPLSVFQRGLSAKKIRQSIGFSAKSRARNRTSWQTATQKPFTFFGIHFQKQIDFAFRRLM